jgi:hypothetical protein
MEQSSVRQQGSHQHLHECEAADERSNNALSDLSEAVLVCSLAKSVASTAPPAPLAGKPLEGLLRFYHCS